MTGVHNAVSGAFCAARARTSQVTEQFNPLHLLQRSSGLLEFRARADQGKTVGVFALKRGDCELKAVLTRVLHPPKRRAAPACAAGGAPATRPDPIPEARPLCLQGCRRCSHIPVRLPRHRHRPPWAPFHPRLPLPPHRPGWCRLRHGRPRLPCLHHCFPHPPSPRRRPEPSRPPAFHRPPSWFHRPPWWFHRPPPWFHRPPWLLRRR